MCQNFQQGCFAQQKIFSFKNRMNFQIHPGARKPHMLLCTGKNETKTKKEKDAEKKELFSKEPPPKNIYIYINKHATIKVT